MPATLPISTRCPPRAFLNPSVVVADDIAVLTYNLVNFLRDANGTERLLNRWNSTTVYL